MIFIKKIGPNSLFFIDEILQREDNAKKSHNTAITIRTNDGLQEPLEINNSGNWFFRLIKKEFAPYFMIRPQKKQGKTY
mgnify:CR=1 FL=1